MLLFQHVNFLARLLLDNRKSTHGWRSMRRFWLILGACLGLAATAVPASANLQYTLNNDSNNGAILPGHNFGTVTLHQVNSTTVQVTVSVSNEGVGFANTGAGYAISWDITGNPSLTSVTIDPLTPQPTDFHVETFTSGQGYTASPFTSGANGNDFQYAIDFTGATNAHENLLVFDVTLSTGLLLTNFIGNPTYVFAADVLGTGTNGVARDVAASGAPITVPEPKTWLL